MTQHSLRSIELLNPAASRSLVTGPGAAALWKQAVAPLYFFFPFVLSHHPAASSTMSLSVMPWSMAAFFSSRWSSSGQSRITRVAKVCLLVRVILVQLVILCQGESSPVPARVPPGFSHGLLHAGPGSSCGLTEKQAPVLRGD